MGPPAERVSSRGALALPLYGLSTLLCILAASAQAAPFYNVSVRAFRAPGDWRLTQPAACLALGLPSDASGAAVLFAGDAVEVSWRRSDGGSSPVDVQLSVAPAGGGGPYAVPYVNVPSPGGSNALNCTLQYRLPAGFLSVTVTSRDRAASGQWGGEGGTGIYLQVPEYTAVVADSQNTVSVCASGGPARFLTLSLYGEDALWGRSGAYPPFTVASAAPGPPFGPPSPSACPCGGATFPLALPAAAPSGYYRAIACAADERGYCLVDFFDPSLPDPKSYAAESESFFFQGFDYVPPSNNNTEPDPSTTDSPQPTPVPVPTFVPAPSNQTTGWNSTASANSTANANSTTPDPASSQSAAAKKTYPIAEDPRVLWWQVILWALGGIVLAIVLGLALYVFMKKKQKRAVKPPAVVGSPLQPWPGTPVAAAAMAAAPPVPPSAPPPPQSPEPPLPGSALPGAVPPSAPPPPPRPPRPPVSEPAALPIPTLFFPPSAPPPSPSSMPTGYVYARMSCPEWPPDVDEFLRWDLPARVAVLSEGPLEAVAGVSSLPSEALLTVPEGAKRLALEVAGCVVAWAKAAVRRDEACFCFLELKTISLGVALQGADGWRVPPGAPLEARLLWRLVGSAHQFAPVPPPPEAGGESHKAHRSLRTLFFGRKKAAAAAARAEGAAAPAALEPGPPPRPFGAGWTPYDTVHGSAVFDIPCGTFFRAEFAVELRARGVPAAGPLRVPGPLRPFGLATVPLPARETAALAAALPAGLAWTAEEEGAHPPPVELADVPLQLLPGPSAPPAPEPPSAAPAASISPPAGGV